jgi:cytochrome c biogenesis protein CcdA/thiol-disulfide isomerase/thioredoxin
MLVAVLAFLGGALTIFSPCILPVLPFVFARAGQPFARSTLPLLAGMAITFAAIATLAAVGGGWAVHVNDYGRIFALVLLALFGIALLSRRVADWIARPFVRVGNRLLQNAGSTNQATSLQSFTIGIATGFLWAPCAGPILGLILTGAAISGPSTQTTLLLFAYALGAMVSLAVAIFAGNRLFAKMKGSLGSSEWLRRGLGVAVLVAVVAIALGLDTGLLTRLSLASTNRVEQSLIESIHPAAPMAGGENAMAMSGNAMSGGAMTGGAMTGGAMTGGAMTGGAMMSQHGATGAARDEGELPELNGAVAWLNSPPLTRESLRGKVVLIDFWTYSCINCLRAMPYVKAWYDHYKDQGLVVIGVHAPEFAFEKNEKNVRKAVAELGITYPVALDNDYAIWRAFHNQYWPAHYFIDAQGRIRGHHFGEGNYEESERMIRTLLAEAGSQQLPATAQAIHAEGAQAASNEADIGSPETYIGYERAENFVSPGSFVRDQPKTYSAPQTLNINQWALHGDWLVGTENAVLNQSAGKIVYRFHARDVHLVLGPGADGKPVRFRVTIDGAAPAQDHGMDIDAEGNGVVKEQRLYQLIRQAGDIDDRTFTIEFFDAGLHAYAFTFG